MPQIKRYLFAICLLCVIQGHGIILAIIFVVNAGKEDTPVHKKNYLLIFAFLVVFSGNLVAAEETSEIIVNTAILPPSVFSLAVSEDLSLDPDTREVAAKAVQAVNVPRTLPQLRPSPRVGKALFDANLVAMIGLNVADYLSTREALKYPGLEESNPLMKPFVKSPAAFAAMKIGTTALTYISFKALFKQNRTAAWVLSTASNFLLSYVVANNLRHIQRAKLIR